MYMYISPAAASYSQITHTLALRNLSGTLRLPSSGALEEYGPDTVELHSPVTIEVLSYSVLVAVTVEVDVGSVTVESSPAVIVGPVLPPNSV